MKRFKFLAKKLTTPMPAIPHDTETELANYIADVQRGKATTAGQSDKPGLQL